MSNQNRIRKSRRIKSTHFVDEVVMCAINDPLPPYHPQTPPSPDYQVCKNFLPDFDGQTYIVYNFD